MPFHKKPDRVREPVALLEAMRPCSDAMIRYVKHDRGLCRFRLDRRGDARRRNHPLR